MSPWNSGGGNTRAGTAISKRHVIFAKHFPLWRGVRIVFVGEDGGVCPVRIEATKAIGDSDIMIGSLDYELTANIKPARILPPDYEKYIGDGKGLPIVTFNRQEKVFLAESPGISTNAMYMMGRGLPKRSRQGSFQESLIVGDSGNPAFVLIGNNPILIYCLKSGGSGMGPALHRYRKEIQQTMDELCPGYKLEEFDFTRLIDVKTAAK